MDVQYDLIIVGAGPAGMTAAIYGSRAGLKVAMLEKEAPGGKMIKTDLICNYPGYDEINGADLSMKMFTHTSGLGADYLYGNITGIEFEGDVRVVKTDDGSSYRSLAVIVATGSVERTLGFPEDDLLLGKGLSYCAVCDGAFFKQREVLVIGGGNSALEEALYLTQFATNVKLVIRRDVFRGDLINQEQVLKNPKIEVIRNHVPDHYLVSDDNRLEGVAFYSKDEDKIVEIKADGLFPYIGQDPATEFLDGLDILNDEKYIKTNDKMETGISGLYAAGDVVAKDLRQIVTAASDGSIAAQEAFYYIQALKSKES